jgi:putative flippase GtrA
MSLLIRSGKFNLVGAMGMAVQLGTLAVLNKLCPQHYLAATAVALELTLVHNFIWHLHYTWRDRLPAPSGAGAFGMARACPPSAWMVRLARFHLTNGLVSIIGNLALTPLMVRKAGIPVVLADAIAILCCSLVNFGLGNNWVFPASRAVSPSARRYGVGLVVEDLEQIEDAHHLKRLCHKARGLDEFHVPSSLSGRPQSIHKRTHAR